LNAPFTGIAQLNLIVSNYFLNLMNVSDHCFCKIPSVQILFILHRLLWAGCLVAVFYLQWSLCLGHLSSFTWVP